MCQQAAKLGVDHRTVDLGPVLRSLVPGLQERGKQV